MAVRSLSMFKAALFLGQRRSQQAPADSLLASPSYQYSHAVCHRPQFAAHGLPWAKLSTCLPILRL